MNVASLTWRTAVFALLGILSAAAQTPAGPYDTKADAQKDIAAAQQRAKASKKYVMAIFGANWCKDCVVLHKLLDEPATKSYVDAHFEVIGVDLGRFDKNMDVAKSLKVDLDKGIPAAAFLASDGSSIGNTNNGELEPSRNYHSEMILHFLHEVVENHKIVKPQ
jgi:thiol-disulfide isomerase/thioredoxin